MVVDKPVTREALRQAVIKVMAESNTVRPARDGMLVDQESLASATAA